MKWHNTKEYRKWRAQVIRRDKKCICGSIKKRTAHHLNSGSFFPDKRYDLNNGICLCSKCHMQFHNNFKRGYRTKCTKCDFDNFRTLFTYIRNINEIK